MTNGTYGDMQQQIAGELGYRADLLAAVAALGGGTGQVLTPIQKAIQRAIAKYERVRFYFNELYQPTAFTTVAGQEFYGVAASALIGSIAHLDKVTVLISANRYTLNPRTWQYIEDTSVNPTVTGQPIDYAYYAKQLRFYPIPNGVYPIHLSGTQRLATLANDADTNAWMVDAEALIATEAKIVLLRDFLKPPDMTQAIASLQQAVHGIPGSSDRGYLYDLKAETARRTAVARVRPTHF